MKSTKKSFGERFGGLFEAPAASKSSEAPAANKVPLRDLARTPPQTHEGKAVSPEKTPEQPASKYFDPALGRNPNVRKASLESLSVGHSPVFVDIIGQRSSVTKWSEVYAIAMTAAQRCLENNASLETASGASVWPGKKYDGYLYLPDIDASVKRPNHAQMISAIKTIARTLHLPVTLRCGAGDSEVVFRADPPRDLIPVPGALVPYRLASKPRISLRKIARQNVSNDVVVSDPFDLAMDARDKLIMVGSKVTLDIEGVSTNATFTITNGKKNTGPNELNADTPIARAVMGHQRGDQASYEVMGAVRDIYIKRVDNSRILYRMGFDQEVEKSSEPEGMSP